MIRRSGAVAALAALLTWADGAAAGCASDGRRVVALGGAVTEIVFALGEGSRLVGVDATSRYPAAAAALPNIGYYRQIAAEGVLSLGPDLVLADADAGPPAALAQLEAAGVCIVHTRDGATPHSVSARVREVAGALQVPHAGEQLAAEIEYRLAAAVEAAAGFAQRPRVLFVLAVEGGAPVAAGRGTQAAAVIELAGGVNAIDGFEGFKPLTPEAAITAAPDVVLLMEHVVEQMGGARAVLSVPALRITPAGAAGRLVAMDGLLLLGFGPRTPEAVERLHNALQPASRSALARR